LQNIYTVSTFLEKFESHPPIYAYVFWVMSLFWAYPPKPCTHFFPLHVCYMSCPPRSPWFRMSNDIWGWGQIMKLLIMQLPPFSCYFIPLRSKYFSVVLFSNVLCAVPLMWETKFHTIQNNWQNYSFVYFNIYIVHSRREDRKLWTEW
jgi:hypothetical protein